MSVKRSPKLLYQDGAMLVLEKPSGLPSLPAKPNSQDPNTVEGWVKQRFPRAKLIHRLDNGTSGLMVAAKGRFYYERLQEIWKTEKVTKKYIALVLGRPPSSGTIETTIAHHPRKKKKMVIGGSKARKARTEYKVLQSFPNHTLLEIRITTGVRHQIRIHLASIGHPIVGDILYQKKRQATENFSLQRHFLHLAEVSLSHPMTQEEKKWKSKLPRDLQNVLDYLK